MSRARSYTDDELMRAVADSRSWRGVLRALGLVTTSSDSIRSVRQRAEFLGIDHSHFPGQRQWTDEQLAVAIQRGQTWTGVLRALGVPDDANATTVKARAARLGLATTTGSR